MSTAEARLMRLEETSAIIQYFTTATPEHLELMGVDPSRLPALDAWRARYAREFELPPAKRGSLLVSWLLDNEIVGFSTADKIAFGEQAHMHLHIIEPERRRLGLGVNCVRQTVAIYFETLQLKQLFCEPNAFNVAPNRTLQRAGFRYVKTHMTVPGIINFHQPVTRWVLERP